MDDKLAVEIRAAIREALAPVHEELARLRALVEQLARRPEERRAADEPEPQASPPAAIPAPAASSAALPPLPGFAPAAPRLDTAPSAAPAPTPASRLVPPQPAAAVSRVEPSRAALLQQLLREYPDDAAAVYFAFDREHRSAPETIDRLAREAGLETAWHAANRAAVRSLLDRWHGSLAMVSELLGRDSDSLLALVDRIGMRAGLEALRDRERDRLRRSPLAQRLGQLLFREKLVRDLGIQEELDVRTRQEVHDLCAQLSGECASPEAVLEEVGRRCNLELHGVERLARRYELHRFVADLFRAPDEGSRPAVRRAGRHESREPLSDAEIERRVLRMLLRKRKVGAAHTHIGHLVRTVPPHERGRAREIIDRMLASGWLVLKTTDNSSEPHVSVAVAALPEIEQRVGPDTEGWAHRSSPKAVA